jgi:hypothetical protein
MGMRPRMDPGAFVQHPIDRRSAQTGRRDNFTYAYASLNIHITIGTVHRTDRREATDSYFGQFDPHYPNLIKSIDAEPFPNMFELTIHLKTDHVNQGFLSDYDTSAAKMPRRFVCDILR